MKVSNVRPVFVDDRGFVRRFRNRTHWHVAVALASWLRQGVLLPDHVAGLRRLRSKKARAFADALEQLSARQRERERSTGGAS